MSCDGSPLDLDLPGHFLDDDPHPDTDAALAPEPEPGPEGPVLEPEPAEADPVPEPAEVETSDDTGTSGDVVLADDLPGRQATPLEHLIDLARHWMAISTIQQRKRKRLLYRIADDFWNAPPESLGQHRHYVDSRVWLEDWMKGGVRNFCEWENVLFAVTIGRLLKIIGNSTSKTGDRQLRFWLTGLLIAAIWVIWMLTGR